MFLEDVAYLSSCKYPQREKGVAPGLQGINGPQNISGNLLRSTTNQERLQIL